MNTRTLRQTATFNAPPRQVYEMLMDSKKHTSLSGEKAKISREAGGRFTAWGGHITGFGGKISEKTRARVKTSKTERIGRQHFRRKLSNRA